jgi:hypothetical protein
MMRWILPKRNTTSRRTAPMRRTKFEGANGVPNESDEMLRNVTPLQGNSGLLLFRLQMQRSR